MLGDRVVDGGIAAVTRLSRPQLPRVASSETLKVWPSAVRNSCARPATVEAGTGGGDHLPGEIRRHQETAAPRHPSRRSRNSCARDTHLRVELGLPSAARSRSPRTPSPRRSARATRPGSSGSWCRRGWEYGMQRAASRGFSRLAVESQRSSSPASTQMASACRQAEPPAAPRRDLALDSAASHAQPRRPRRS